MKYLVCLLACLCVASQVRAEVRETRDNAFTIESIVTTSAAPAEVYRAAGAFTMESAKLAPIVDHVMGVQLGRLKALGDTLKPPK